MKLSQRIVRHSFAPFAVAAAADQRLRVRVFRVMLLLARLALGSVLLYAGVVKLADIAAFAEAISNFDLLPPLGNQLVARTLPCVEIVTGLLLICGLWLRGSALVSVLMFLGFSVAVVSALARGLNIECGCFGTDSGAQVGLHALAIEAAGLLAGILVLLFPKQSVALLRLPKKVASSVSQRMSSVSARVFKKK